MVSNSVHPAVSMKGIFKRFGRVQANQDVAFSAQKGEIHALIGENGAGKSTLMKILYGMLQPDSGEIRINGASVRFGSPKDAIKSGIGMVHQHFMLVPVLTVAENMVLGKEPARLGGLRIDLERARNETRELSARHGLSLDPDAKVADLSVGQQQRIEILKLLYRGAGILILDEPTAVLTPQETERFFEILKAMKGQGKTVILITHKLKEVVSISESVTVMRKGRVVGTAKTGSANERQLAQMMVGRPVVLGAVRKDRSVTPPDSAIRLEKIRAVSDRGLPALNDLSLEVHEGEILGIAGVEGNGQTELAEVILGLRRPVSGRIILYGKPVDIAGYSVSAMRWEGVSFVPEDRHRRGLVLEYSVAENLLLGRHRERTFSTRLMMRGDRIAEFSAGLTGKFDISPPDVDLKAAALSGGNQQKLVVARELSCSPRLLVAAQPTRGVDVGAIEFIHKKIIETRNRGAAVLLISADLAEILSLADTVAVMYRGAIAGSFPAGEADEQTLGLLMAGAAA